MRLARGTRIEDYEIERVLPGGGFASVAAARERQNGHLGRRIALKIAHAGADADEAGDAYALALASEVLRLQELYHPGLVRVLPLASSGRGGLIYRQRATDLPGAPWFFGMEYLAGGQVDGLIERNKGLPLELATEIVYQVALTLVYVHARGYAHLDVKPSNLLLRRPLEAGARPEVVLIDLGTARKRGLTPDWTGTSLPYCPPEHLDGIGVREEEEEHLGAADVWALGVTYYQMLTGRMPFGGSPRGMAKRIRDEEPVPPSRYLRDERSLHRRALRGVQVQDGPGQSARRTEARGPGWFAPALQMVEIASRRRGMPRAASDRTADVPAEPMGERRTDPVLAAVDTLVLSMLAKDPEDRPDMHQVASALDRIAPPPRRIVPPPRRSHRRSMAAEEPRVGLWRRATIAATAVVLALGLGIVRAARAADTYVDVWRDGDNLAVELYPRGKQGLELASIEGRCDGESGPCYIGATWGPPDTAGNTRYRCTVDGYVTDWFQCCEAVMLVPGPGVYTVVLAEERLEGGSWVERRQTMEQGVLAEAMATGPLSPEPMPPSPEKTDDQPTALARANVRELVPGRRIDEALLRDVFASVDDEQRMFLYAFAADVVSPAWRETIGFTGLTEEPLHALKFAVSLVSYRGGEEVSQPAYAEASLLFDGLVAEDAHGHKSPLGLLHVPISEVPRNAEHGSAAPLCVWPRNLVVQPGFGMTVIGLLDEDSLPEDILVADQVADEAIEYALVALADNDRRSTRDVPRHYWAILPAWLPADEVCGASLTLANLLKANGYAYDPEEATIAGSDAATGSSTLIKLNVVAGEELVAEIQHEAGIWFADVAERDAGIDPVVPYYRDTPAVWRIEQTRDQDDQVCLILKTWDDRGALVDVAQAIYQPNKDEWAWRRMSVPVIPEHEVMAIAGLDLEWNGETDQWEYLDPNDDLVAGYWDIEGQRFELLADELRGEWVGLWVEADASVADRVAEDLVRGQPSWLVNFDIVKGTGRIKQAHYMGWGEYPEALFVYDLSPGIELKVPFDAQMHNYGITFVDGVYRGAMITPDYESLGVFFSMMHPDDYLRPGFSVPQGTVFYVASTHCIDTQYGVRFAQSRSKRPVPSSLARRFQVGIEARSADDERSVSLSLLDLARTPEGLFYYWK